MVLLKRFIALGLLAAGVGFAPAALAQRVPRLRQGMSYADARQRLLDRGWQPVVNSAMVNPTTTTPIVAYLLSQGYSELMGCQLMVGVDICTFQFRNRKGHLLEIGTVNLLIFPGGTVTSWVLRKNSP
ncbi:hypothetical protein RHP47_09375 [Thermosynechococcus sp. QKsg1]|uniref:hypothetical protein n=1 Tax=unclassified Thermosynechococcus TaxID=2622553 RepID=UPI00122E4694|nr:MULTISPECIES: hypothetical protein [unclassified Thermosynechococcus]QEQ01560.1 hypothetical protein FFX45_09335 [Thermosynechococcus sp. CL-1]WJI23421.1 hypothetical protein MZ909_09340 [Thermosynechococcus sp. B0]WJI25935.1 hypothetical protein M0644_09395 [Thermosynechococcus sp. B1]WJI28463.1 hypothetical protein M0646_09400 [Thermosynechococcus sp. B3]WKT83046.1 hypothetical protein QYC28_09450 [Thermosynechococcus sp. HY596]